MLCYQLRYYMASPVVSLTLSVEAILSKAKYSEGRLVRSVFMAADKYIKHA